MGEPHNKTKWEGYSNRETWAVCLSLNNTEWMHKTSQALLKEAKRQAKTTWANSGVTEEEETKRLYAAGLQKYIEIHIETFENSVIYDKDVKLLINNLIGLCHVDWREVAEDQLAE